MLETRTKDSDVTRRPRTILSMRLIVTVATVMLVAGAVIGVGSVTERNVRKELSNELQTRLVLEARNLAMTSAGALLSAYPELTLHPIVKTMEAERPDLAMVYVVDHEGVIQGHADAARLGEPLSLNIELNDIDTGVKLISGETLRANDDVIVVDTPIHHPSGKIIGSAIVGLERSHIDVLLARVRRSQTTVLLVVLAVAMILTPILVSLLLRPIGVLRSGLERIGRGDLDFRLRMSSRTELGVLGDSVNDMAARLKAAQMESLEKQRLDHEMDLAHEIQQSLLPGERIEVGDYLVTGAQVAADEVGGDYYDVFDMKDGRVGLLVADVAGKGLAGCLVTSMMAVLVRTLSPNHSSPSELLIALEEALDGSLQPGTFITVFYGMMDTQTGLITFASAGHNPVLHYCAEENSVRRHDTRGIPIGLMPTQILRKSLDDFTLRLAPGDVLVQYTDGYHEAVNVDGEEFGLERMVELIAGAAPRGNDAVRDMLQEAIDKWEGTLPAADDKTLLVVSHGGVADAVVEGKRQKRPEMVTRLWDQRGASRHHFSMQATFDALDRIGVWLSRCDGVRDLSQPELEGLEQGLYEVGANIVEHACALNADEVIDFWWIPDGGTVVDGYFLVRDKGNPPESDDWAVPLLNSSKVRKEGRGLGLRIIHHTFAEVEMHPETEVGNVTILKYGVEKTQKV